MAQAAPTEPLHTQPLHPEPLHLTPLHALHLELGARMVPFAGYQMPVQYPGGILAEHRACRDGAVLFDVSHMGQILLKGEAADAALETLVPQDVRGLGLHKQRYALFTAADGGLLDDLMVTRRDDGLYLVVNAGCKQADLARLQQALGGQIEIQPQFERALLALQGPRAAAALAAAAPHEAGTLAAMVFMTGAWLTLAGHRCYATRSGYTGEDGFEIAVPAEGAHDVARTLLAQAGVQPAGLGARDTLRLEAGLCLYGHDIDAATSPIEAGLNWAIQKVRRPGGERAGGYPGAEVIGAQLAQGSARKRVGLRGLARTPVREGAPLSTEEAAGQAIGKVTSGTLSPTLDQAIAMGYLPTPLAQPGTRVQALVRGKPVAMEVVALPFVPQRYHRG